MDQPYTSATSHERYFLSARWLYNLDLQWEICSKVEKFYLLVILAWCLLCGIAGELYRVVKAPFDSR